MAERIQFYTKLTGMLGWIVLSSSLTAILTPILLLTGDLFWFWAHLSAWGCLKISGIKVEVENAPLIKSSQPCLFMANHQSGFDMISLGSVMPRNTTAIGKRELLYVPIIGQIFWLAGLVLVDRKNKMKSIKQLKNLSHKMRSKGLSLAVMPEGTRNPKGDRILPLKKGPFHIAMTLDVPALPIICEPLFPERSFEDKRITSGTIRIRVLPPIPPSPYLPDNVEGFRQEVETQMQEALADLAALKS